MFTPLFTLAAVAAFAVAQITINAPTSKLEAIQCEDYQVTWTGGTGPFEIRLLDSAQNFIEEVAASATRSPIEWTVNQAAGTVLLFFIHDSTGNTDTTGQFTVQSSSNTGCLVTTASASVVLQGGSETPAGTVTSTSHSATLSTSAAPSAPAGNTPHSSSQALPGDAIAGIAVGTICGVLLIVVGAVRIIRRLRRAVSAVSNAPIKAATSMVTSVEPYPLTGPRIQRLGSFETGSGTPVGWERKNRQDVGPSTTAEHVAASALEDDAHPVLPRTDSSTESPPPGELSDMVLDRLVNQVLRRLQAQEAPPSYPASSHPGSGD